MPVLVSDEKSGANSPRSPIFVASVTTKCISVQTKQYKEDKFERWE